MLGFASHTDRVIHRKLTELVVLKAFGADTSGAFYFDAQGVVGQTEIESRFQDELEYTRPGVGCQQAFASGSAYVLM